MKTKSSISAQEALKKVPLKRESRRKGNPLRDFILNNNIPFQDVATIDEQVNELFSYLEKHWAKSLKTAEYAHEFKFNNQLFSDAAILVCAMNDYNFNMSFLISGSPTAMALIDVVIAGLKNLFEPIVNETITASDFQNVLETVVKSESFPQIIEHEFNSALASLGYNIPITHPN